MFVWFIVVAGLVFGIWFLRICFYTPEQRMKKLEKIDQKLARDQYDLGMSYLRGEGVPQDPEKALKWIRKASQLSHPEAQNQSSKMYASKEVQATLGAIEEVSYTFNNSTAFSMIKKRIENMVLKNPDKFSDFIRTGPSPRLWIYRAIVNISDNLLGTGQYCIYRGTLGPVGEELVRICDAALDQLVELNDMDVECAQEQKAILRNNIKGVG